MGHQEQQPGVADQEVAVVAMKMEVRDLELAEQAHRFKEMPVEMEQMQAQAAQLVLVVVVVAQALQGPQRQ